MVLDASAALELLLDTTPGLAVAGRMAGRGPVHAPHLLDAEVVHAVRRLEGSGEVSSGKAAQSLDDLLLLPLERHPHTYLVGRAWDLRRTLSAYDALYVALAELLDAPLLTRDVRLARAHGHRARVELV
jgi:predicted nucleic acid-binding protein